MTPEEFKKLNRGDLVRHKNHADACVVDRNLGDKVITVQTKVITQPNEWDLVAKAGYIEGYECAVVSNNTEQLGGIVIPGKMTSPMLHVIIDALATVIHKENRFGKNRSVTGMTACGWNWKVREWKVSDNWKYVTCKECLKVGKKREGWK